MHLRRRAAVPRGRRPGARVAPGHQRLAGSHPRPDRPIPRGGGSSAGSAQPIAPGSQAQSHPQVRRRLHHHPRRRQDPHQGQGPRLARAAHQPHQGRQRRDQLTAANGPMARLAFIPGLLERHYEELAFLWGQRGAALGSQAYTLREFLELEERIEAHAQGLLIGGEAVAPLVTEGLSAEERPVAFAAAYALLKQGAAEPLRAVVEAVLSAKGPQLDGLCDALVVAGPARVIGELRASASTAPPPVQAGIEWVTTWRNPSDRESARLDALLKHENPAVRATAWQAASFKISARPPALYDAGLRDADAAVRGHAMLAAAWGRYAPLLTHCRSLAARTAIEHLDAIALLAILGKPEDFRLISAVAKNPAMGPTRLALLGTFGHPEGIDQLLRDMRNPDPATAAAAGAAFTKITGHPFESTQRAQVQPSDGNKPDEFEKEFFDEVNLPDVKAAQSHWDKVKANYAPAERHAAG